MRWSHIANMAGRWLFIVLPIYLAANAQSVSPASAKAVVKFRTSENHKILIDASFGKGPTRTFVLDSGAIAPALLDRAIADEDHLKLKRRGTISVHQSSSEILESSDWREAEIHAGKVTLLRGVFPTVDLSAVGKELGSPSAGIIGVLTLMRYVVKIDYSAGELQFFDPKKFQYLGGGQILSLEGDHGANRLIVKVQAELPDCSTLPVRLLIDTGDDSDMTFNPAFLKSHPTLGGRDLDPGSGSISAKPLDGSVADFRSVRIGSYSLSTPQTAILHSGDDDITNRLTDGDLGAGILSQFTIYVDYPDGKVIFEPMTDKPPVLASTCVPK